MVELDLVHVSRIIEHHKDAFVYWSFSADAHAEMTDISCASDEWRVHLDERVQQVELA